MSFELNRATIMALLDATRNRDAEAFGAAYAPNAVVRQSGVPESLGGVVRGRDAVEENFRRQDPSTIDVQTIFGDDTHVCVVGKLTGIMTGSDKLKGNNRPFTTYECTVYTLSEGLIEQQLVFVNWLDPYVQAELVELAALLA